MDSSSSWIKSTDPATGRTFYANKLTRTTQWEVPDGWIEREHSSQSQNDVHDRMHKSRQTAVTSVSSNTATAALNDSALPQGWEESIDPKSGRMFYINHVEKKTTWDRPGSSASVAAASSNSTYSNLNTLTLNQFGSHSKWVDPRKGSRYGSSAVKTGPESPLLEFTTVQVPDSLRLSCPSCRAVFGTLKRRHHCRLCGDVFCDSCSTGRAVLPLEGEEFSKSVRVCDLCLGDVKRGNYFTWRRYLTPLQLYNPGKFTSTSQEQNEITIDMVAASLSSLSVDLDAILANPQNLENQISIPADVIISATGRHLKNRQTAEYAIRVLASLVTLGNVLDDDSFALAIYGIRTNASVKRDDAMKKVRSYNSITSMSSDESRLEPKKSDIVDGILSVLEWGGSDSRTVEAQGQAAKIMYYITDPKLVECALSSSAVDDDMVNIEATDGSRIIDVDAAGTTQTVLELDVHRAFRAMLDHATSASSTSLQRWATASLGNLITEDQRRACTFTSDEKKYQSFTSQLVSTGGVMILCSLLASDDSDTRLHATSALEGVVLATREIEMMSNERGRQQYRVGRGSDADSEIVNAIVANGGCGYTLAQLLCSSEESVAMKGCEFSYTLVSPLLTDPKGSSQTLHMCASAASSGLTFDDMNDDLNSYRHAALALAVGDQDTISGRDALSCLPSLIQIMRSASDRAYPSRTIQLQIVATKVLAAVALAICSVVGAANCGIISENSSLHERAKKALEVMETERIYEVAFHIATSSTLNTLDPSRNTPQSQLREVSGLILFAVSACSNISAKYLLANRAVSELLRIASDAGMLSTPSSVRGEWTCRGACYLEAAAALMIYACKTPDQIDEMRKAAPLDALMEAIDAGTLRIASQVLKAKVNLQKHDVASLQIRVKIACCFILSAMFEVCSAENGERGKSRLYEAIDADCAASIASNEEIDSRTLRMQSTKGRSDIVASTIALLRATLPFAQKVMNDNSDEPLPMIDLSEACLFAVGGMCGAVAGCFAAAPMKSNNDHETLDQYSPLIQDACELAFDALRMNVDQGKLLPVVLIGALGGSCIVPMLRLSHAIAENGPVKLRGELARVGIFTPLGDLLQSSLSADSMYIFTASASIVRYCGSAANARNIDTPSARSLTESIQILSSALSGDNAQDYAQRVLRMKSLDALEGISTNEFLSNVMITVALPALTKFLTNTEFSNDISMVCSALNCICRLVLNSRCALVVAESGIAPHLSKLIDTKKDIANNTLRSICLHILHSLALNGPKIRCLLVPNGVVDAVAKILESYYCVISDDDTKLALETISLLVSDSFQSPELKGILVHEIRSKQVFLRRLIATMTDCVQKKIDPEIHLLPHGSCFPETASDVAIELLVQLTLLLCADQEDANLQSAFTVESVSDAPQACIFSYCSYFYVINDDGVYNQDMSKSTIQQFILNGLSVSLKEYNHAMMSPVEEMIRLFQIPQACLSLCQNKDLNLAAIELFETLATSFGTEVIGSLLLHDKASLASLLDTVTLENSHRVFGLLCDLAKDGSLSRALVEFELRNRAIATLSAAIVSYKNDEFIIDEDSSSFSRILVDCLALILYNDRNQIEMNQLEARTVASTIGKILASTVLHQFYIQASRETTLTSIDHSIGRSFITTSSEARLLCASALFADSLQILNKVGGLEAISLLAHDGEITAISALAKVCKSDPNLLITVDAHLSVLDAMACIESKLECDIKAAADSREVLLLCMDILTELAANNDTKDTIFAADKSVDAVKVASQIIVASAKKNATDNTQISILTDNSNDGNPPKSCSSIWDLLLSDDYILEHIALSVILLFAASKSHRNHLINDMLIRAIIVLAKKENPTQMALQSGAVEVLTCFTKYNIPLSSSVLELLITIIENKTKLLHETRDTTRLLGFKKIAALAVSGMQNLFTSLLDNELKQKAITACSELFIYLTDSFYYGPKSKRLSVTLTDGMLLTNLASLFLFANVNMEFRNTILSNQHTSSMLRFVMMASGADGRAVLTSSEGSDYFDAAMELILITLSYVMTVTCQGHTEKSLGSLIQDVEPSPGAFINSLEYLSSEKLIGGASRVIAKKLLADIVPLIELFYR